MVTGSSGWVYVDTDAGGGSGWGGWQDLGSPTEAAVQGTPGIVTQGAGYLDVFVRGSDDYLYDDVSTDGGGTWSGWNQIGSSQVATDPEPVVNGPGWEEVYAIGLDGSLLHAWSSGNVWQGWGSLGYPSSGPLPDTDPAPTSASPGSQQDIFVQDTNGNVWDLTWTSSGGWSSNWVEPDGATPTPAGSRLLRCRGSRRRRPIRT